MTSFALRLFKRNIPKSNISNVCLFSFKQESCTDDGFLEKGIKQSEHEGKVWTRIEDVTPKH